MRYQVQPATSVDVAFLAMLMEEAPDLPADPGTDPADLLLHTCASSTQIWAARDIADGTPMGLWGVTPGTDDPGVGRLWMLACEPLGDAPGELEALSRLILGEMLDQFPRLENHIDARKARALDLFRSIGFTIEPGVPRPGTDMTMHHVWIESDHLRGVPAAGGGMLPN